LPEFAPDAKGVATRSASGKIINAAADVLPELLGGSADLEPSNKTLINSSTSHSASDPLGRNIHFGVREHAMGSLCNGMAYHGGLTPYCATFLVFSDYQRPAVRISALAKLPVVYVYTHDSIGVGGDGPTHQPIEHIESLRAMPGLTVIRPADANETRVAWQVALEQTGPTALILTRQNVPVVAGLPTDSLRKGAYVALEPDGKPDGLILATGSELSPAMSAATQMNAEGHAVRVVSMPSWELFEAQDAAYKDDILPPALTRRLAVEAGATLAWWKYVGSAGAVLGIDGFGASAPGDRMFEEAGITVDGILSAMAGLY
jgi:transketolase